MIPEQAVVISRGRARMLLMQTSRARPAALVSLKSNIQLSAVAAELVAV